MFCEQVKAGMRQSHSECLDLLTRLPSLIQHFSKQKHWAHRGKEGDLQGIPQLCGELSFPKQALYPAPSSCVSVQKLVCGLHPAG